MEDSEREFINSNLTQLIKDTKCNADLLSRLLAENVFSQEDQQIIETMKTDTDKAKKLYELVVTRRNAFFTLKDCLKQSKQSGAFQILDKHPTENYLRKVGNITYNINSRLGTAGSNAVYEGFCLDKVKVAVKRIQYFHNNDREILREVKILEELQGHENIVRLYHIETKRDCILVAMEFCEMTLEACIVEANYPLPKVEILRQTTTGLGYLHSKNIIHGDVKPTNVLLAKTSNGVVVKLADFGISKQIKEGRNSVTLTRIRGSQGWMAPEYLKRNRTRTEEGENRITSTSCFADIFPLGCLFYYLMTGGTHLFGEEGFTRDYNIAHHSPLLDASVVEPVSDEGIRLIKRMIEPVPDKRPTCSVIVKDPFLNPTSKNSVRSLSTSLFPEPTEVLAALVKLVTNRNAFAEFKGRLLNKKICEPFDLKIIDDSKRTPKNKAEILWSTIWKRDSTLNTISLLEDTSVSENGTLIQEAILAMQNAQKTNDKEYEQSSPATKETTQDDRFTFTKKTSRSSHGSLPIQRKRLESESVSTLELDDSIDIVIRSPSRNGTHNNDAYAIGIDVGTKNCCVAIYKNGEAQVIWNSSNQKTIPSYVLINDNKVTVGEDAREVAFKYPKLTIFDSKRIIGLSMSDKNLKKAIELLPFSVVDCDNNPLIVVENISYTPEKIASYLIQSCIESVQKHLDKESKNGIANPSNNQIPCAVITIPTHFNDDQRLATENAAKLAGLTTVHLMDEPVAAAFAYLVKRFDKKSKRVLIFDLGGGTFDVAIVDLLDSKINTVGVGGEPFLGGENFDNEMVNYCIDNFHKQYNVNIADVNINCQVDRSLSLLRQECEKKKTFLDKKESIDVVVQHIFQEFHMEVNITREKYDKLTRYLVEKMIAIVDSVLRDNSVMKEEIDEIVLVGASTRAPSIQEALNEYFPGKRLNSAIDPDEAVAYGAAVYAAVKQQSS